jgi:hypothetical protein
MKRLLALLALLALAAIAFAQPAAADEAQSIAKAKAAATAWLALSDGGKYGESWDAAAQPFKDAGTREAWEGAIRGVRAPLGAVLSRKLKSARFTRTLPGAPDGEYVVIQYDTAFRNKAGAVETIAPMLEKDGAWRVSGYFIR